MKQRYCFIFGLVAFLIAAALMIVVLTNMEHGEDGEEAHVRAESI